MSLLAALMNFDDFTTEFQQYYKAVFGALLAIRHVGRYSFVLWTIERVRWYAALSAFLQGYFRRIPVASSSVHTTYSLGNEVVHTDRSFTRS